ncbi:MAG: 5-formyltetrahydrofolate cyclo-ligase [Pseudomonadota bacterium]
MDLRIVATKAQRRKEVLARRAVAHRDGAGRAAAAAKRLLAHLDGLGRLDVATRVAGYRPIRSEIDTAPVLATMAARGVALAMPVVEGAGQPLGFRPWAPGVAEVEGAFGAPIPADATAVTPRILIVPLVAFDEDCFRLGYGGGFYDRSLERLRAADPDLLAIGYAYAAQATADLPREPTDQRLDAVVTEDALHLPPG